VQSWVQFGSFDERVRAAVDSLIQDCCMSMQLTGKGSIPSTMKSTAPTAAAAALNPFLNESLLLEKVL
jgi:hypothetical protein